MKILFGHKGWKGNFPYLVENMALPLCTDMETKISLMLFNIIFYPLIIKYMPAMHFNSPLSLKFLNIMFRSAEQDFQRQQGGDIRRMYTHHHLFLPLSLS